jgi:hypothetical protein
VADWDGRLAEEVRSSAHLAGGADTVCLGESVLDESAVGVAAVPRGGSSGSLTAKRSGSAADSLRLGGLGVTKPPANAGVKRLTDAGIGRIVDARAYNIIS